MYEIAAKTFWAFLQPSNFLLGLILLGLMLAGFKRRAGRVMLCVGVLGLGVGGFLPVGKLVLAPLENRFPSLSRHQPAHVDGIIILGGGEQPGASDARQQVILTDRSERLITGAMLAIHYPTAKIIHTGGTGDPSVMLESDVARQFFTSLGLTGCRFIYEDKSVNTYENAIRTMAIARPKTGETWLLVTSAFHMPRAVGAFRQAGWRITPYPVDYMTTGADLLQGSANTAQRLEELDLGIHEWVGLAAYKLLGKSQAFFPAPQAPGGDGQFNSRN